MPASDSDALLAKDKLQGIVSINDLILLADAKSGGHSLLGTEVMDTLKNICAHRPR